MLKTAISIVSALLLSVAILRSAQTTNSEKIMVGTWKLNVSKSKFNPKPGPTGVTAIISEDGSMELKQETADGKSLDWTMPPSKDGATVPISGAGDNATYSHKVIDQWHTEDHWKTAGGTTVGKGTLSKDGKTLKYVSVGTSPQGKKVVHDVQVFEKQ
jgi:hypothetical protein